MFMAIPVFANCDKPDENDSSYKYVMLQDYSPSKKQPKLAGLWGLWTLFTNKVNVWPYDYSIKTGHPVNKTGNSWRKWVEIEWKCEGNPNTQTGWVLDYMIGPNTTALFKTDERKLSILFSWVDLVVPRANAAINEASETPAQVETGDTRFELLLFFIPIIALILGVVALVFILFYQIILSNSRKDNAVIHVQKIPLPSMPVVISILVLLSALYVILTSDYREEDNKWAYGIIGTIVGYWLNETKR